jgi:membrane protein implicated in regulation of membrane protease activity
VRTFFHLSLEVLTALFFAASIGIGAGVAATSFTHRLGDGLRVALVAFLTAGACFAYVIWRNYRPLEKAPAHRSRPVEVVASR